MTNKITLSRELAERLDSDHSYVRNLARLELRAALAEPVPPAGGEPEVVANVIATGGPHDREDRVLCELQAELPPVGTELVDRAHVTLLQAEVERLKEVAHGFISEIETKDNELISANADKAAYGQNAIDLRLHLDVSQAELTKADNSNKVLREQNDAFGELIEKQNAELTKARELVAVMNYAELVHDRMQADQDLKKWANQSAPVAVVMPPEQCRQRIASEGKPYPRSSCAVCGQFSPKSRECDALIEAVRLNPIK